METKKMVEVRAIDDKNSYTQKQRQKSTHTLKWLEYVIFGIGILVVVFHFKI